MFEEYGQKGQDCAGQIWERRSVTPQMDNLTNQTFGKLLALFPVKQNDKQSVRWLCQCSCGNIKIIKRILLRNGHTQSCGCIKSEMMKEKAKQRLNINIGDRFNFLTVKQYLGTKEYINGPTSIFLCQCDCGRETIVSGHALKRGNTKSCGRHCSIGELKIYDILKTNNIIFSQQFSFPNLLSNTHRRLYFDFAIFNKNNKLVCLIEYQGSQHYFASGRQWNTEENFKLLQQRDNLKREYCNKNNILLYEIKYNENIEEKIQEILINNELI